MFVAGGHLNSARARRRSREEKSGAQEPGCVSFYSFTVKKLLDCLTTRLPAEDGHEQAELFMVFVVFHYVIYDAKYG